MRSVELLLLAAAMVAAARSGAADTTCPRSGFAPPPNTTLAVDLTNSAAGVVVTPTCNETPIAVGGTQFETSLTIPPMEVVRVVSYPRVHKLCVASRESLIYGRYGASRVVYGRLLGENQIETFTATSDSSLLELYVDAGAVSCVAGGLILKLLLDVTAAT